MIIMIKGIERCDDTFASRFNMGFDMERIYLNFCLSRIKKKKVLGEKWVS